MTTLRAETVFVIDGERYPRRPTFAIIAAIERQFGAIWPLLQRATSASIGIEETATIVHIILGGQQQGAPKLGRVQEAVFEEYSEFLKLVAEFLVNAITDPSRSAEGNATAATQ
jgi:hypothetical protein